ncbi:hypothetical protein [Streptomyces sp. UNOC14_S4]|uniref:hypothetical protein n=1 Tax=Streptomyces sp. UNOC14_S4 TaxID=2872340 RepID=UPI001E42364F|nr:hypothetical protein [Streptomyces sp. UNOC14_S4]MCC3771009.1 hypothetical protein [Streptomyces sp. UNOC14_S4]
MSEAASADRSAAHSTSTSEIGSFCSARCSCGWRGPARRARSLAREDATTHMTAATAVGES